MRNLFVKKQQQNIYICIVKCCCSQIQVFFLFLFFCNLSDNKKPQKKNVILLKKYDSFIYLKNIFQNIISCLYVSECLNPKKVFTVLFDTIQSVGTKSS